MRRERARRFWPSGGASGGVTFGVISIDPDIGFALTAGTTAPFLLTIRGFGFIGTETVSIGGVAANNVTFVNSTTITCNCGTLLTGGSKQVVVSRSGTNVVLATDYWCEPSLIWLRADVGSISSWTDLSGNGNHAVQATGGNQPTAGTGVNGLPAFTFVTDDFMVAPSAVNVATLTDYVILRADGNNANEGVYTSVGVGATADNNNAASFVCFRATQNINCFRNFAPGGSSIGPANGAAMAIQNIWDGTNNTIRTNNNSGSAAQAGAQNVANVHIACRWQASAPALFFAGTYSEFIRFSVNPAAATMTRIRRRLANRYNISTFL